MGNIIEYAGLFEANLDILAVQTLKTGFMDSNAAQIRYNGGSEVKVPTLTVQGLGDYSRANGYVDGSINLEFQTFTMSQDRGRKFLLDAMDVDESNFVATASSVMSEFQRKMLVPEIDAYRIAKLAKTAIDAKESVEYGYSVKSDTIILKIKEAIKKLRETGYDDEELDILATYDVSAAIEEAALGRLNAVTFSQGGIDTQVPAIDGCPVITVPQSRMYTEIKLYDGSTEGQKEGGFVKGENSLDINFMVVAKNTPIAVTKQDKMRIFTPDTYQKANAWSIDYRRYHDLWVMENRKNSIFVNIKDAEPSA
ncbi:MAG: hypothetical protein HFE62_04550 [Firmicutes bacterium]|nr:hypothetical protein [Bacillota bacterium]